MKECLAKLYTGDFNVMNQVRQPDDSVIITLHKAKENKSFRFRVKNLYQENEEVLEEEVIESKQSKFLQDRMKQARKEMEQRRGK